MRRRAKFVAEMGKTNLGITWRKHMHDSKALVNSVFVFGRLDFLDPLCLVEGFNEGDEKGIFRFLLLHEQLCCSVHGNNKLLIK